MTSLIETIKAKVDVVEEIGLVVALSKSGKYSKGLCPFHNERTPSFYVFAENHRRGVVLAAMKAEISSPLSRSSKALSSAKPCITWLKRQESLLKMRGDATRKKKRESSAAREQLRKLNEDALLWFHQMLLRSKEGSAARTYVQERGISNYMWLHLVLVMRRTMG